MVLLFVAVSARNGIQQAHDEVKQTGTALYRVLSQRAAQHDAHLTSLNALILAANPAPLDALRQVSRNIIRFYPRITAIDVLLLTRNNEDVSVQPAVVVDESYNEGKIDDFATQIAQQKPGEVRTYLSPQPSNLY